VVQLKAEPKLLRSAVGSPEKTSSDIVAPFTPTWVMPDNCREPKFNLRLCASVLIFTNICCWLAVKLFQRLCDTKPCPDFRFPKEQGFVETTGPPPTTGAPGSPPVVVVVIPPAQTYPSGVYIILLESQSGYSGGGTQPSLLGQFSILPDGSIRLIGSLLTYT
jgi:hypothetical protein